MPAKCAPVAQLDRAPDYESGGQEFESLRARHFILQFSDSSPICAESCGSRMDAARRASAVRGRSLRRPDSWPLRAASARVVLASADIGSRFLRDLGRAVLPTREPYREGILRQLIEGGSGLTLGYCQVSRRRGRDTAADRGDRRPRPVQLATTGKEAERPCKRPQPSNIRCHGGSLAKPVARNH